MKIKNFVTNKQIFIGIPIMIVIVALVVYPEKYISSAYNGLVIFATKVVPSLFPFFFLTRILTSIGMASTIGKIFKKPMSKLYGVPSSSAYIFFMSLISGYPIGAKLISDMYDAKVIDESDAKTIMTYTSMSGPLFIIGTVASGLLGTPSVGYIMLAASILGAMINGLFYRKKNITNNNENIPFRPLIIDSTLESTVNNAVISILMVGGYIIIFYIIADVLYDIGILKILSTLLQKLLGLDSHISKGICLSLVEMTRGIVEISKSSQNMSKIAIINALIAFGGLSITIQSMTFLSKIKIKVSYYLRTKLTQSIITLLLTYVLLYILNPYICSVI